MRGIDGEGRRKGCRGRAGPPAEEKEKETPSTHHGGTEEKEETEEAMKDFFVRICFRVAAGLAVVVFVAVMVGLGFSLRKVVD